MNEIPYGKTICLSQVRMLRLCLSLRYSVDRSLIIPGIALKYGSSGRFKESGETVSRLLRKFFRFLTGKLNKNKFQLPRIPVKNRIFIYITLSLKKAPLSTNPRLTSV